MTKYALAPYTIVFINSDLQSNASFYTGWEAENWAREVNPHRSFRLLYNGNTVVYYSHILHKFIGLTKPKTCTE